jgi:hypothetical protein
MYCPYPRSEFFFGCVLLCCDAIVLPEIHGLFSTLLSPLVSSDPLHELLLLREKNVISFWGLFQAVKRGSATIKPRPGCVNFPNVGSAPVVLNDDPINERCPRHGARDRIQ